METVNVTVRMERQTRDDAARFYEGTHRKGDR